VSRRVAQLAGNAADLSSSTGYADRSLKLAVTAAYDFFNLTGTDSFHRQLKLADLAEGVPLTGSDFKTARGQT